MTRRINRSNLFDLRQQLNETVMTFPEVKTKLDENEFCEVPVDFQLICYNGFTVSGILQLDGQLVIL